LNFGIAKLAVVKPERKGNFLALYKRYYVLYTKKKKKMRSKGEYLRILFSPALYSHHPAQQALSTHLPHTLHNAVYSTYMNPVNFM
jgi:hypothetical protein